MTPVEPEVVPVDETVVETVPEDVNNVIHSPVDNSPLESGEPLYRDEVVRGSTPGIISEQPVTPDGVPVAVVGDGAVAPVVSKPVVTGPAPLSDSWWTPGKIAAAVGIPLLAALVAGGAYMTTRDPELPTPVSTPSVSQSLRTATVAPTPSARPTAKVTTTTTKPSPKPSPTQSASRPVKTKPSVVATPNATPTSAKPSPTRTATPSAKPTVIATATATPSQTATPRMVPTTRPSTGVINHPTIVPSAPVTPRATATPSEKIPMFNVPVVYKASCTAGPDGTASVYAIISNNGAPVTVTGTIGGAKWKSTTNGKVTTINTKFSGVAVGDVCSIDVPGGRGWTGTVR